MAEAKSAIRTPVFNKVDQLRPGTDGVCMESLCSVEASLVVANGVDTLQGFQGGAQEDTCGNRSGWYGNHQVHVIEDKGLSNAVLESHTSIPNIVTETQEIAQQRSQPLETEYRNKILDDLFETCQDSKQQINFRFEDFIRWHSPTDSENDDFEEGGEVSTNDAMESLKNNWPPRGRLSERMSEHGNLWQKIWNDAPALTSRSHFWILIEKEKRYLHRWELDAALDVITMCSCHLPKADLVKNEVPGGILVVQMRQDLLRYKHILSADDHYCSWQEVTIDSL
ncbi:hypothetical protein LOK49_LG03G02753 [Camellia lanceoleosa]|uniref:Uncharacterized protein n=1 Tax=Camellia lanceoleosa TaxID=1840588 RepID=A0ACC0IG59_9ERIC|nr:hypothetical protein LOK49_LG03G02753 [Camellia lanceoleosa]